MMMSFLFRRHLTINKLIRSIKLAVVVHADGGILTKLSINISYQLQKYCKKNS